MGHRLGQPTTFPKNILKKSGKQGKAADFCEISGDLCDRNTIIGLLYIFHASSYSCSVIWGIIFKTLQAFEDAYKSVLAEVVSK